MLHVSFIFLYTFESSHNYSFYLIDLKFGKICGFSWPQIIFKIDFVNANFFWVENFWGCLSQAVLSNWLKYWEPVDNQHATSLTQSLNIYYTTEEISKQYLSAISLKYCNFLLSLSSQQQACYDSCVKISKQFHN